MSKIEVKVPDIGDFDEVEVIEVLVSPGDEIEVEQSLITVESDKASMEIPSSAAGKLVELSVKVGDKVSEGTLLAVLEAAGAGAKGGKGAAAANAPATAGGGGSQPSHATAEPDIEGDGRDDDAAGPQVGTAAASAGAAAPAGAGGAQTGPVELKVPDIGDFDEVEVIEILVGVGDTVAVEQSLITVESDKASMEIPASDAGEITELKVKVGDKVSEGSLIAVLKGSGAASGGTAAASAPAAAAAREPSRAQAAAPAAAASGKASSVPTVPAYSPPFTGGSVSPTAAFATEDAVVKPHASPSVRKFARELGVDLARVRGSGDKQRITHDDVRAWVKGALAGVQTGTSAAPAAGADGAALGLIPWPKVDFAKFGPIETKPVARIRKISAANLHRNWVMIPHVTNHDEADITDLEAFRVQVNAEQARQKDAVKLTMLAFLIKACVSALKKFPEFNASLDGDNVVLKQYWHIGFAADTPNGLMVPVIRDADKKGIFEIAAETSALAAKARDGKLGPADMQGGTFSISSLGGIGGTYFTPIINAPEVAILGVCRSATKPLWDGKAFQPRLVLPLSLSWDHRAVDGAAAARFNAYLAQLLADFRRTML